MGVQPASRGLNTRTFMVIIRGDPSIQMDRLGINFKYEENNSVVTEALEGYLSVSTEAYCEYPGQ